MANEHEEGMSMTEDQKRSGGTDDKGDLAEEFGLGHDEDGRHYLSISAEGAYKLWLEGLKAAKDALDDQTKRIQQGYFFDDDSDYFHAITDQIEILSRIWLIDDNWAYRDVAGWEGSTLPTLMLGILNDHNDGHLTDKDDENMAFQYGYADHRSPISDLAYMNTDEAMDAR